MLPLSFVLEFVCLFAVVGGMLCKSDKPSIIIIIIIISRGKNIKAQAGDVIKPGG